MEVSVAHVAYRIIMTVTLMNSLRLMSPRPTPPPPPHQSRITVVVAGSRQNLPLPDSTVI